MTRTRSAIQLTSATAGAILVFPAAVLFVVSVFGISVSGGSSIRGMVILFSGLSVISGVIGTIAFVRYSDRMLHIAFAVCLASWAAFTALIMSGALAGLLH